MEGGKKYTKQCDTESLSDTTSTFCIARVPLSFCLCNTPHTILTSANDTFDRELPCVYELVNDLELASRTPSIICVSRLCYLLLLSKSCVNMFVHLQAPSRYEMLLTFLSLYKLVQLSC